jgi:hypothetical protein
VVLKSKSLHPWTYFRGSLPPPSRFSYSPMYVSPNEKYKKAHLPVLSAAEMKSYRCESLSSVPVASLFSLLPYKQLKSQFSWKQNNLSLDPEKSQVTNLSSSFLSQANLVNNQSTFLQLHPHPNNHWRGLCYHHTHGLIPSKNTLISCWLFNKQIQHPPLITLSSINLVVLGAPGQCFDLTFSVLDSTDLCS